MPGNIPSRYRHGQRVKVNSHITSGGKYVEIVKTLNVNIPHSKNNNFLSTTLPYKRIPVVQLGHRWYSEDTGDTVKTQKLSLKSFVLSVRLGAKCTLPKKIICKTIKLTKCKIEKILSL